MLGVSLVLAVPILAASDAAPARTIEVIASRFRFDPPAIELQEGESVMLLLRSADGTHGFSIKGYDLKTKIPKGGEVVRVQLVASKVGSFEIACSEYCGSGHRRMKGTLLVKARAN